MEKNVKILITIRKGMLYSVATNKNAEYVVIDNDCDEPISEEPTVVDCVIGKNEKFYTVLKNELSKDECKALKELDY